jgi:hypothetical protein
MIEPHARSSRFSRVDPSEGHVPRLSASGILPPKVHAIQDLRASIFDGDHGRVIGLRRGVASSDYQNAEKKPEALPAA